MVRWQTRDDDNDPGDKWWQKSKMNKYDKVDRMAIMIKWNKMTKLTGWLLW